MKLNGYKQEINIKINNGETNESFVTTNVSFLMTKLPVELSKSLKINVVLTLSRKTQLFFSFL